MNLRKLLSRRALLWIGLTASLFLLGLMALGAFLLRPAHIKALAEKKLEEHLNLDASIEHISVSLVPSLAITGRGLALRIPNRPDLPPFISIASFAMEVGVFSILREHVDTVHADGLKISVPPADSRPDMSDDGSGERPEVIIDHFITHDALLTFVRSEPGKNPLQFAIADLEVDGVGFNEKMPFRAHLTNPIPRGEVAATGHIGPWRKDDGTRTPLDGEYTFTDADLSTINGIGGRLSSKGSFTGNLVAIDATGVADVPDFNLDLGGKSAHLVANFETTVNGTDGTTVLKKVEATLGRTPISVTGAIVNLEGPGRHAVDLRVHVAKGRIEDLLSLVIDAPKPVMVGAVSFESTFSLPPGPTRVRDRVRLAGSFGLAKTQFTNPEVQDKLTSLSRRSQGKDEDDPVDRVLSNLRGRFALAHGRARLNQLTFQVPGAEVALDGTYGLADGALEFQGTLTMEATVSKAVGGFKSFFLKPFDGLFKKDGAGAVLPIKIRGTRDDPSFGLEMGKVFKRGK